MTTKTKPCTKCGVEKPYKSFGKDKVKPLGLKLECRECKKKYNAEFYKGNKEWFKGYVEDNQDKLKVWRKAYFKANKEYFREYSRSYLSRPGKSGLNNKSSARSVFGSRGIIPKHLINCEEEVSRLKFVYIMAEVLSKTTGDSHHVDHMWPVTDGGPHWSGNLQILTREENLKKSSKVCENLKKTIQESLAWEIQRHNNTKSTNRNKSKD